MREQIGMKLVYADFNNVDSNGKLPLTCVGSIESIARLHKPLENGEEVWLTDGELRTKGRVSRRADGSWEAESAWEFSAVSAPHESVP